MTYAEAMAYVAEKCPNVLARAYAEDGKGAEGPERQKHSAQLVLGHMADWRDGDPAVRVFLQDLVAGR